MKLILFWFCLKKKILPNSEEEVDYSVKLKIQEEHMASVKDKKVVVLIEDIYEEMEAWYPIFRLREEGAEVLIAGPKANHIYKSKMGYPCKSTVAFGDVNVEEISAVICPGGYAPDKIRRHQAALDIVRGVFERGGIVAHICHAGWVPISAGILRGRRTTSYFAIRDDLMNAGAHWVDDEVVVDGNLISSRTPEDLPAFMKAVLKALSI